MEDLVTLVYSSAESSDASVRNTAMRLYNALLVKQAYTVIVT